jgi:hypothetical protein
MARDDRGGIGAMGGIILFIAVACVILPGLWERARPTAAALSHRVCVVLLKPFAWSPEARRFLDEADGVGVPGNLAGDSGDGSGLGSNPGTDPFRPWAVAGRHWRLVFLPLQIMLMLLCSRRDPAVMWSRPLDMWGLLQNNAGEFPCLLPIVRSGPITLKPQGHGEWALAQSPVQFAAYNELLFLDERGCYLPESLVDTETGMARLDAAMALSGSPGIHNRKTALAFVCQLGKRFEGDIRDLPYHRRALAIAFMAHYEDEKDLAFAIFDSLSESWDPVTKKVYVPDLGILSERYASFRHPELELHNAFQNVWFMALLRLARRKGALPSSLWIWLKPTDRRLFYVLNQVGGRAAWCEGAGAWSHFVTERRLGRPIPEPVVGPATRSLEAALEQEGWLHKDRVRFPAYYDDSVPVRLPYDKYDWQPPYLGMGDERAQGLFNEGGVGRPIPWDPRPLGSYTKPQIEPKSLAERKAIEREKARQRRKLAKEAKDAAKAALDDPDDAGKAGPDTVAGDTADVLDDNPTEDEESAYGEENGPEDSWPMPEGIGPEGYDMGEPGEDDSEPERWGTREEDRVPPEYEMPDLWDEEEPDWLEAPMDQGEEGHAQEENVQEENGGDPGIGGEGSEEG